MSTRKNKGPGDPLKRLQGMPAIEVSEIGRSLWSEILSMQNEKKAIERQIALPLAKPDVARKHGLIIPKVILLFGRPGTGKTLFAKAVSGELGWKFVEISPSALGITAPKEAFELKIIFDTLRELERVVIFFDEFEELAMRPDRTTKDERMLSNEFLKQLPKVREAQNLLLICATNNIRMLNPALLRPGRFEIIFPVGALDKAGRRDVFKYKTRHLMVDAVDFNLVAEMSRGFTPADVEVIMAGISQKAFEKELSSGTEYRSTTDDFLLAIGAHTPTVSMEEMEEFRKDAKKYCRADYCRVEPWEW